MAKIEDKTPDEPEETPQQEAEQKAAAAASSSPLKQEDLCDPPTVWVLGHMEGNVALRLGWASGLHVVSNSRFKFLQQDMKLNVVDDPEKYLF